MVAFGAVVGLVGILGVAVARAEYSEAVYESKDMPTYTIPTPAPGSAPPIIGQTQLYRVRKGDTLMDIARLFSLGYNEIVHANPGIDPWVPPAGAVIILPTEFVLPCCQYSGIVMNIPEMRLFYYQPAANGTTIVHTHPVGLGRDEWRTPRGKWRVRGKTVNPQWNIPASIRAEHIRDKGDYRTSIAGGAPDNPLGKYRLELTMGAYRIHGTNIPWGVGMQVSHGCVRLYPEEIEALYPKIPVGTNGAFEYEVVKVGMRDGAVYVEVQNDIYGHAPAIYAEAMKVLERQGLADQIDKTKLVEALEAADGIPARISGEREGAELLPPSELPTPAPPQAPAGEES
jgi:L,D-transpeptidase ErfK/SrfK